MFSFNYDGSQNQLKEAVYWLEVAAALNHADAICMIGFCYYEGYGVDCDIQTALEHLEKAQQLGSRMANTMLLCISEYQRLADEGFGNVEPKRDDDDDLPF